MLSLASRMAKKTVYAFDHIPKCAGTSMHALLAANLPGYRFVRSGGDLLDCAAAIVADGGNRQYIGGHFVYGLHELLPAGWSVKYFTLLREPLEVAYSFYKHAYKIGVANYGSFLDFLYENPCRTMTLFLGNSCEQAIARLENYSFVGFVDRPAVAMAAIAALLGHHLPPLPLHNVTPGRQSLLDEMDRTALPKDMADVRLYEHFRRMADDQADARALSPMVAPQTEPAPPCHYAASNADVDGWYQGKWDGEHLAEVVKKESNADSILYMGNILANSNVLVDDACFEKIVETQSELFVGCLNASRITTQARFERVYGMALKLLHGFRFDTRTAMFVGARNILLFLALSPYAKKNGLSDGLLRELLTLNPHDFAILRALAIHLRLADDYAGALAALLSIPQGNKTTTTYCNEYLVTKALYDGQPISTDELLTNDVFAPLRTLQALLEKYFDLSGRIRLSTLAGKNVLVMRSGPVSVLDDVLRALGKEKCVVSILLQQSLQGYQTYTCYGVQDGWFDPAANEATKATLQQHSFDSILLLCSDYTSLNKLHNFIEFCRDIPHDTRYAYPLSNLFVEQAKKSLIPLA